jgi:hypothetical protein
MADLMKKTKGVKFAEPSDSPEVSDQEKAEKR